MMTLNLMNGVACNTSKARKAAHFGDMAKRRSEAELNAKMQRDP